MCRSKWEPADEPNRPRLSTDLEKLEELKNNIFERFRDMFQTEKTGQKAKKLNYVPKVGDLVKIIELQRKLSSDSKAEEKFWEAIERIRKEELTDE